MESHPNSTNNEVSMIAAPSPSGLARLMRGFIEGNYFYVVSAIVFLLGCKLLMRSPLIGDTNFARTLFTLVVLQGYEVLVIAAALLIARHFRMMNDAFTLLIIEMTLLLDPTFFSNSFFTMLITESHAEQAVMVNVICLMLVPAKLIILSSLARVRLSLRTWLGLGATAALIYLGPYPFSASEFPLDQYAYYYMLGWGSLLVALLLPSVRHACRPAPDAPELYMTSCQSRWLPRFLVMLPFAILVMHYVEHRFVHPMRFYWLFAGPPILAFGAMMLMNAKREGDGPRHAIGLLDVAALAALFLTMCSSGLQGKEIVKGQVRLYPPAPDFLTSAWPLVVAGGVAIGLYLLGFWRLRYKPALYRAGALGLLGMMGIIVKSGVLSAVVAWLGRLFQSGRQATGTWREWAGDVVRRAMNSVLQVMGEAWELGWNFTLAHPWLVGGTVGAALLVLAWRRKCLFTWLLAGFYWIVAGVAAFPGSLLPWTFEMLQAACAWMIVCYLVFGDERRERYVAAMLMIVIGLGRCLAENEWWAYGAVAGEGALLAGLGWWRRDRWLTVYGVAAWLALGTWLGRKLPSLISPSLAVIGGGLILFGVGLWVTFKKTYLLDLIQSWDERQQIPAGMASEGKGENQIKADSDEDKGQLDQ